jgi:hypothetical protein
MTKLLEEALRPDQARHQLPLGHVHASDQMLPAAALEDRGERNVIDIEQR